MSAQQTAIAPTFRAVDQLSGRVAQRSDAERVEHRAEIEMDGVL